MQDHSDGVAATSIKHETFFKSDYQDAEAENARARANFYRFLATCYLQPPTQEFLQHFADMTFINELQSLFGDEVVVELQELTQLNEKSSLGLRQEYMDLFVVPAGHYVTPFEDVYRGLRLDGKQERGPLLGDRAVAVKTIYRIVGANLDKTCKELPTHIGVELLFMSFLCEQEANGNNDELADKDDETQGGKTAPDVLRQWQLKFLHEHLTDWFPQLNQAIQNNAYSAFYPVIASITDAFLTGDKEELVKHVAFDLQVSENQTNPKGE